MRTYSSVALVVPILMATSDAALAHAHLQTASPPVDGTVATAPNDVSIAFSEGVEPSFSTIEVTDASGKRVDDGKPHLVAGDQTRLAVAVPALPPGTYAVAWHATSVDTHKTDGTYRFTLVAADASAISVEHAWARASAGAATTGAAYLIVTDAGQADHLIGVSTPVAAVAELHESTDDNGVMKMRPVASIALDPGKPVTLKPGGYHVMLTGLKAPLMAGDNFPLTLKFEHAQPITVTVTVEKAGASAMDHSHMDHGGMAHKP